MNFVTRKIIQM